VKKTRWALLLSPLLVIGVGHLTARITGAIWGLWSWIPVTLVYWVLLALMIVWGSGRTAMTKWLQPSQGAWGWRVLSLLTVTLFLPVFFPNFRLLNSLSTISYWFALALIDPWLEEGYWRGLLMDSADDWPGWLVIGYSTFWFALSHPLILGVNVHALSGLPGFVGTCFTGTIWAVVYRKTRSLRWPIFSHTIVDLVSLSVLVFLNRVVLPT
jgi:membrane protease YdiL (CAAX protease family)